MPFPMHFPCTNASLSQMQLEPGEMLFVLGANGVGKSSLMHQFTNQNRANFRKISAHRQTWMASDAMDMTPAGKVRAELHMQNDDYQLHARYKDQYAAERASMTIYELINAENTRARNIAFEVDAGRMDGAKDRAKFEAPITVINELLRISNISIEITIEGNERLMASVPHLTQNSH